MPGPIFPGVSSVSITPRNVRLSDLGVHEDGPIRLSSDNADSTNTPTTRFREGNVVVLKTSTGEYVEANDATGDVDTPASITTGTHTDGNGVIKLVGNHGTISVTTSTGTGTEANNATDLNADAAFAAHYVASSAGGDLTITSRNVGSEEWFYIHSDTMSTADFAEGIDNAVSGADADFRITLQRVDLVDESGTAVDAPVRAARWGYFDESNLLNLTKPARAAFVRRGSIFA